MNEELRFKKFMFWDLPEAPELINHVGIWTQACLAPTPSTLEIFCNLLSVPQRRKEDSQNLKNLNPKLKENKYFKELSPVESKNSPTGSAQSKPSLSKQAQAAGAPPLRLAPPAGVEEATVVTTLSGPLLSVLGWHTTPRLTSVSPVTAGEVDVVLKENQRETEQVGVKKNQKGVRTSTPLPLKNVSPLLGNNEKKSSWQRP